MNLYEEILKQGYKIEEMRSHSNKNRVYIINEQNERIGYYSRMDGTKTKLILKKEPIFEDYCAETGFLESLRFPRSTNGSANKAINNLYKKFVEWKKTEELNKSFERNLIELTNK
ncbi:hypothetical protein AU074_13675 [Pseudomonas sp. ATCC PTA-122608]|uniref:hypothetical protein n=1 Tax=Pseudomonas sp. ATCC PTA-122608 TaxID=1771311 RepID=UPI00096B7985|nr:hypothetical protein [Pseudomonas sp. ATCC PTA-122608]OLY72219.1 hypothetical protein AU074_13675 [Pseudomonas sp. ATCC PTA-122608]